MKYNPFRDYDKHGCLKPPVWLYLALAFLLRSYVIWIISLSFRQDSTRLLSLFYPDKHSFMLELIVALPAVIAAALASLRRIDMPGWLQLGWHKIRAVVFFAAICQLTSLIYHHGASISHFMPLANLLLFIAEFSGLILVLLYCIFSQRLADASKEFPQQD